MGNRNRSRGPQASHRQYIRNLTLSMMGQLRVEDGMQDDGTLAQMLWKRFSLEVLYRLEAMAPETLGRIASFGRMHVVDQHHTSLYLVHCETWLDKKLGGRSLLARIAATAIIAEMTDIIHERRRLHQLAHQPLQSGPEPMQLAGASMADLNCGSILR